VVEVVVVEDEGGTYELSAVEAIYQLISLHSRRRRNDVQETTTGAGAASELD